MQESSILADTYALFDDRVAAGAVVPLIDEPRSHHDPKTKKKFEGKFGGSKLHTYAKDGQWTKLLASATVDLLYILDEHHRTPLHYAIENGAEQNVVLELIRIGPFLVRVPDSIAKETPMHLACDYGMGLVSAYSLLDADGRVRRNSSSSSSSIHQQQQQQQPSVLTLKNDNGKTPMDLIRRHDMKGSRQLPTGKPTFMGMLTSVTNVFTITPWKYHTEEHPAVWEALEEAARGET